MHTFPQKPKTTQQITPESLETLIRMHSYFGNSAARTLKTKKRIKEL